MAISFLKNARGHRAKLSWNVLRESGSIMRSLSYVFEVLEIRLLTIFFTSRDIPQDDINTLWIGLYVSSSIIQGILSHISQRVSAADRNISKK